jgi:hypothetical protein
VLQQAELQAELAAVRERLLAQEDPRGQNARGGREQEEGGGSLSAAARLHAREAAARCPEIDAREGEAGGAAAQGGRRPSEHGLMLERAPAPPTGTSSGTEARAAGVASAPSAQQAPAAADLAGRLQDRPRPTRGEVERLVAEESAGIEMRQALVHAADLAERQRQDGVLKAEHEQVLCALGALAQKLSRLQDQQLAYEAERGGPSRASPAARADSSDAEPSAQSVEAARLEGKLRRGGPKVTQADPAV